MKLVHGNDMVCHLWVNQSQPEARNGNGSIYFEGDTIFSYGVHFPMARHVNGVVLITSQSYSVTTGKHIGLVSRAASHLKSFNVPDVLADSESEHMENVTHYLVTSESLIKRSFRARSNAEHLMDAALELREDAAEYVKYFKINYSIPPVDDNVLDALRKNAKQEAEKQRERNKVKRERDAAELEKRKIRANNHLVAWLECSIDSIPYELRGLVPLSIRYNKDKDRVESTLGAQCPVEHAQKAFWAVKHCYMQGKEFKRNGSRVQLGSFDVDYITASGDLKAGCHFIKWAEIKRFGDSMGWA